MATLTQLGSGNWRVQVRRKGRYAAETFRRRKDGEEWALDTERCIDRGVALRPRSREGARTLGDLIDLHIEDMHEVGKPPRRSKAAVMDALKTSLGGVKIADLTRERLIEFGKRRAKQGAGPTTLSIDFSFIRTILSHAAAVHGIETSAEDVRLARIALNRLSLIGRGNERDRRPTEDETNELIKYFESNSRQLIPMARIMRFAIATAMREDEICRIEWPDVDMKKRTIIVRDRKIAAFCFQATNQKVMPDGAMGRASGAGAAATGSGAACAALPAAPGARMPIPGWTNANTGASSTWSARDPRPGGVVLIMASAEGILGLVPRRWSFSQRRSAPSARRVARSGRPSAEARC